MSDKIETNLEQLPLKNHSVDYVYHAIKRTLNLHPDDYRSARGAMRYILAQHEEVMLAIGSPTFKKE